MRGGTIMTNHHLWDARSGEDLGPATAEQIAASDASEAAGNITGQFLIDRDGDVIANAKASDAHLPGVRVVYTQ